MKFPTRNLLFASALLAASSAGLFAQTASLPATPPTSAQGSQAPSAIVEPAVIQIRQTLSGLRTDKWKTPGPVTQETAQNLASIQRDLDTTLPGLLATADRNAASVQDVLPAYRNVDALYDVLLRVTEVSKLAAPSQQSTALQQAMVSLEDARRTLGDQIQSSALNQTKAIVALQGQLKSAQTAPTQSAAATPVCPTPAAPATKKRPAAKPKPKPAATTPH